MSEEKLVSSPPADVPLKLRYVGFQQRLFATMIDMILTSVILLPFASMEYPPEVTKVMNDLATGKITELEANQQMVNFLFYGQGMTMMTTNASIQFLISGIVVILFWFYRSATPGKMLLKMRIVDADTGGKPPAVNLIVRYIGYFVAAIPFFLGFFWIAIDKHKQGWHDKMANTVVIFTDKHPTRRLALVVVAILMLSIILLIF